MPAPYEHDTPMRIIGRLDPPGFVSGYLTRPTRSLAQLRAHYAEMRLRLLFAKRDAEAIGHMGVVDYCERELAVIERRLEMIEGAA